MTAPLKMAEAADAQPFTPETLAGRWQCHHTTIRKMIARGELKSFRVGGTLLRIRARDVEEFERCQNTDSDATETNGLQSPEQEQAESELRLARIERRQIEPSSA